MDSIGYTSGSDKVITGSRYKRGKQDAVMRKLACDNKHLDLDRLINLPPGMFVHGHNSLTTVISLVALAMQYFMIGNYVDSVLEV